MMVNAYLAQELSLASLRKAEKVLCPVRAAVASQYRLSLPAVSALCI